MLFRSAFLSALLLSPSALAAPGQGTSVSRHSQSQPKRKVDSPTFNPKWAGAVWSQKPDTFATMNGTFTVPSPSGVDGSGAAAWVGIDGYTCRATYLQTGISFIVLGEQPTYTAWYQWSPAATVSLSSITVSEGDSIQLSITATSATTATVSIQNLSKGDFVSKNVSSDSALCGRDAGWVVEDFDSTLPFANFGTVEFTGAHAGGYTPNGAQILDIKRDGQALTSVSINGSSVTIQHV